MTIRHEYDKLFKEEKNKLNISAARKRLKFILEEGCDIMVDKTRARHLPEWFDEELFISGQKCYLSNIYTAFIVNVIGLILVASIPTVIDVVVLTNKSNTPFKAYKRYTDTLQHVLNWYTYDVKDMKSKCQKSISVVHGLHCAASQASNKCGLGKRVTQTDMAISQFIFMGLILLKKKELGFSCTENDEMAIVHLWRTLGYFLGIDDKFNLCQGTLEEVRDLCAVVLSDVYTPSLSLPPKDFDCIVEAMIEGFKPVLPIIDLKAIMRYTRELCYLPTKPLTSYKSRWLYNVQELIHNTLLTKQWLAWACRPILNYLLRISVWINMNFPVIAAIKFGTRAFHDIEEPHNHIN
ncbi:uncharacterized protein LOC126844500 isoform X2 [Adelges cooleyi]|uniref:uncharacterized protein LOC126844500 isoform X2 n=1 Tax=Adelges cooleyi TaxID=133065 RepID=UPI00217F7F22|nr:uncharacterized protein LOC126844500 isoform X2 [Adelges cooleyi]